MRKPFDKDLFKAFDAVAKAAGLTHLMGEKAVLACWCNPARYGADLMYTYSPNSTQAFLETEVKTLWKEGPFPYKEVQIPERKRKYFVKGVDYLLLAANNQDYLVLSHADILSSPSKPVPNKYVRYGELFFVVPLEKAVIKKFDKPIKPEEVFCCAEASFQRETGLFRCKECGEVASYV